MLALHNRPAPIENESESVRVDILGIAFDVQVWTEEQWNALRSKPPGAIPLSGGGRILFAGDVDSARRMKMPARGESPPAGPVSVKRLSREILTPHRN